MTARNSVFIGLIALAASFAPTTASADPILRFSTTTGGGIVATGNALGLSKQLDANGPGTEDSIGTFMRSTPTRSTTSRRTPAILGGWNDVRLDAQRLRG